MFPEIYDPEVGNMRFTNTAIRMSETMPGIQSPAPTLGQHNQEVYSSLLGYSEEKIQQLKDEGII